MEEVEIYHYLSYYDLYYLVHNLDYQFDFFLLVVMLENTYQIIISKIILKLVLLHLVPMYDYYLTIKDLFMYACVQNNNAKILTRHFFTKKQITYFLAYQTCIIVNISIIWQYILKFLNICSHTSKKAFTKVINVVHNCL